MRAETLRKPIAAVCLLCLLLALFAPQAKGAGVKSVYSTQRVLFNGAPVTLEAYNIGGYNYFRLRDVAALLSDTIFRFSLETQPGERYVHARRFLPHEGAVSAPGGDRSASAVESAWRLTVDGERVSCAVYNVGGSNFYRLRDLADAFGFAVGYDTAKKSVLIAAEPLTGTKAQEEACFAALRALYAERDFDAGAAALEAAAKDGCARAAYELAQGCYDGLYGLKKDYAKAYACASAAAEGGNPRGQYLCALLLWQGQGVEQDTKRAVELFAAAAEGGNVQAQSFLCAQYYAGEAVKRDYAKAFAYASAAAAFGDARACFVLGQCLYSGRGTAADPKRAFSFFLKAGEGGIAEAVHALGVCYYRGRGVSFNPYIALHYFELAAEMGCAAAAYNAGLLYDEGVGTQKDAQKALAYMRMAAEGGVAEAMAWLAGREEA